MPRNHSFPIRAHLTSLLIAGGLLAAPQATTISPPARAAPPPTATETPPFLAAYLADFDEAAGKLLDLAGAVDAEHYGWRPAPGVRSIGEVYSHVAGANLFFAGALGHQPPEELPRSLAALEDKEEVLRVLELSLEHVREAVTAAGDGDLSRPVEISHQQRPLAEVLLLVLGHLHEHLGQSIAYARTQGVVPPWSGGG